MAAFSSDTLISDGDFVAGVATEAVEGGGGGVGGGGNDEAAEAEFGEFLGVELEADAAPALFPPFFFFGMVMRMRRSRY